jgi:ubiquitin-conjugating enzyme E2 Z
LIIGPPETPYEYGFFEFSLKFGNDYPSQPPKVDARTTNKGQCRFNPNIYAQGKVCLSILGTWAGETSGEEWSSAQGLESILISIQSLMSSNPYENEPGFEAQSRASPSDKSNQTAYIAKIRHETLRIAVIQKLEKIMNVTSDGSVKDSPPAEQWYSSSSDSEENSTRRKRQKREEALAAANFEPFSDLLKQRFLWYYASYISTCTTHLPLNPDNQNFVTMPFENQGNTMDGHFQYSHLLTRLQRLKALIDNETLSWATQGLASSQKESSIASKLARQFEQLTELHKKTNIYHVSMSLDENENPFLWILTYFGKPGTLLDGGCFKITIHLSPRFPDEQPRVKLETPIFHHRVSECGVVCYFPRRIKSEDMGEHVRAVMESLEEENPPCDPRTVVRAEASSLMWGSEQERKKYKRLVRKSAEESVED